MFNSFTRATKAARTLRRALACAAMAAALLLLPLASALGVVAILVLRGHNLSPSTP